MNDFNLHDMVVTDEEFYQILKQRERKQAAPLYVELHNHIMYVAHEYSMWLTEQFNIVDQWGIRKPETLITGFDNFINHFDYRKYHTPSRALRDASHHDIYVAVMKVIDYAHDVCEDLIVLDTY